MAARSRRAARARPQAHAPLDAERDVAVSAPPAAALDIQTALAALPASTRDAWILHHVQGVSFHSIAARLGVTVMAAKLRSSRAMRALRAALGGAPESLTMADHPVPAALLSAVRRDLAPVRPLASTIRRALALLPVGVALLIGIPMFWAWHRHVARPIGWPSGGLSALETTAGLTALAAGFREAIPGRELSLRAWAVVIGLVWSCFLAINASAAAPTADVPLQTTARWIGECITEAAVFSVPALAATGWLVRDNVVATAVPTTESSDGLIQNESSGKRAGQSKACQGL